MIHDLAATRRASIAKGVSPWKKSHTFISAATRRKFSQGETNASIIRKPVFSPYLQHQESNSFHFRRTSTETLRIHGRHPTQSEWKAGCGRRYRGPCSSAGFPFATSIDFGHTSRPEEQLIRLDPRDVSRPEALCMAIRLRGVFGKFLGARFGAKVSGESEGTSQERDIPRRVYQVSQIARIGIRRALPLGLRRGGTIFHPVGAARFDGSTFQGLTPLAINSGPFGTKDNARASDLRGAGTAKVVICRNAVQVNSQGCNPWNASHPFAKAATRRQFTLEETSNSVDSQVMLRTLQKIAEYQPS